MWVPLTILAAVLTVLLLVGGAVTGSPLAIGLGGISSFLTITLFIGAADEGEQ